ncbi:hypothetical protein KR084_013048 [Drosophila pseudotakahashii]|nr:hypothetical protein KR084_013048 [Drosophila pseudotakahashii]
MDKRFKWPLKQRANHSESPYHHNPSRGYPRHLPGHPNQPQHPHQLGHPNQPLHPHQHPGKRNARQHYGYSHGGGGKGFRKALPPPPPLAQEPMGGGAMPPPSSGGSVGAGADMVTLIVENNNLKRMIVLHLKLMQEQTDSLTAKEKDLDDQSARMGVVLAKNQELMQAVAKLEAANEDLRQQLRRKNQRRNDDDDDDDDHLLPPAAPQQKVIRCHAETQTVIREREQCTQTMDAQPQLAEVQPRILSVEEIPAVPHLVGAVPNLPGSKRSESKGRGEFNGKKVSTFILQRMNQDSKHHIQEQTDQVEEQAMQAHEEQLQLEEDDHLREEVHLQGEDDHLQIQEVQAEEVVGSDIFHDALETFEMEVVTEELVDLEEQAHSVDANGHMEEDEDEENQENNDEDDNSEEDDEDEDGDGDDNSVDSETDVHFRNEDDLWQNQINSMEFDTTAEKALAPSAHSTPNHQQKSLPHADVRKDQHQEWKAEKRLHQEPEPKVEKHLDQLLEADDQMEVHRVEIVPENIRKEEGNLALKTLMFLKEAALKEKEKAQQKVVQLAEIRKEPQTHQDGAALKQKKKDHENVVEMPEIRKVPQSHLYGAEIKQMEKDEEKGVELTEMRKESQCQQEEAALIQKEKVQEKGAELTEIRKEPQRPHDGATKDHKAIKKPQEIPKAEHKPPEEDKGQDGQDDVPMEQPEDVLEEQKDAPKMHCMEQVQDVLEEQKDAPKMQPQDSAKQLVKAVVPKVAAAPSPSVGETKLPKANAVENHASSAHKIIANHQSTKTQTEPVKKKRLQVNVRQHEMFSGNRTSSSTPLDPRKHKSNDQDPGPETKITKQVMVNDTRKISEKSQDLEHVESVKRKLQEHLKKELLSQIQLNQVAPKKTIRERTVTNLIYPPPSAPLSSTTITPAPTPSTTPTPGSTPQPALTSSMEPEISASKSKSKAAEQISTPLTPQSNSSVSSTASTTRKTLNNCSPHTYSRATARSGKSKSRFRTATFPYTTRTWEDQDIHCDNEFFLEEADELLADNPSLEIPKWKDVPVLPSEDKSNTEPLDDAVFERRHQKYVKDEIDRKCRDARYMKEQLRLEGLRNRRNQDEVLVTLDPLPTSTFYPLPEDIEGVQIVTEVTVQAFGENMVNMEARDDFGVAWVDALEAPTSIARSKALAEPVATLASKKLPTTAAEARHQENHSSYVFPKRRKRQKNR